MTKLKAFTEDKIHVAQLMNLVFDRLENIVGKAEKCWLQAFSSFATMISKGHFLGIIESRDCVVKS